MGRSSRKVEIVFDLEQGSAGSVASCPAKVNTQKITIKSSPPKKQKRTKRRLHDDVDEDQQDIDAGQVLSPRSYKRMIIIATILHIAFVAAHFFSNTNGNYDESPLLMALLRAAGSGAQDDNNNISHASEPVDGDDEVMENRVEKRDPSLSSSVSNYASFNSIPPLEGQALITLVENTDVSVDMIRQDEAQPLSSPAESVDVPSDIMRQDQEQTLKS
jgi:hypothetical protein